MPNKLAGKHYKAGRLDILHFFENSTETIGVRSAKLTGG